MNWTNARWQVFSPVCFLVHFFVLGSKKLSPQSFSIILSISTPNFLAYIVAKTVRVNAQLWRPAEKETVPFSGPTWQSPSASSVYVAMRTFAFSMTRQKFCEKKTRRQTNAHTEHKYEL